MEVMDFKEKNSSVDYFQYKDFFDSCPKGNLYCKRADYFKYTDNYLKFIPLNRNTIFELIIRNMNIKPYRIHCYDKMQIYQGGKRRNISINSFVFREFLGIKDREHETVKLRILLNNSIRVLQLLFSEKEI